MEMADVKDFLKGKSALSEVFTCTGKGIARTEDWLANSGKAAVLFRKHKTGHLASRTVSCGSRDEVL